MPQENLCLRIIPTGIKVNDSFPVQEKKTSQNFFSAAGKIAESSDQKQALRYGFFRIKELSEFENEKIYMQSRYEIICFYFYFFIGICGVCCRNG